MNAADQSELERLAAAPLDAEDAELLSLLAQIYNTVDPVPAGLVDRVQFGLTLDALHAEIAELQTVGDLTGVRSGEVTDAQTVTFTSAHLTTMVTITPLSADEARVDGWLAPGGSMQVDLRTASGVVSTTADAGGRFVFERVERGMAQFVLRHPAGAAHAPVVTPTIEI